MSVQAKVSMRLDVTEFISATAALQAQVVLDQFSTVFDLNASTTPAASKVAAFVKALVAGVATIDLVALVGVNGAAVVGTGLKVRALLLHAPAANANPIVVTEGATNGYLFAGTDGLIEVKPGQRVLMYLADGAPTIDSTHKTLDLAGTLTQSLNIMILLG